MMNCMMPPTTRIPAAPRNSVMFPVMRIFLSSFCRCHTSPFAARIVYREAEY
jgi:hypothetical protein